jgi:hypothetical protein
MENQRNHEKQLLRMEQDRAQSAVVIDMREQLSELRNRENELLAEIRIRDKTIHKLEKEKNEALREHKEHDQIQGRKIDEYEKNLAQLERKLLSETWNSSGYEGGANTQANVNKVITNATQANANRKDPENEKRRILEENLILQKQNENLEQKVTSLNQKIISLERENERFLVEKESLMQNMEELEGMNEELTLYLEKTKENFERTVVEVQEKSRSEIQSLKQELNLLREQERNQIITIETLQRKISSGSNNTVNSHEKTPPSSLRLELDTQQEMGSYSLVSPKFIESTKLFSRNGGPISRNNRRPTGNKQFFFFLQAV